MSDARCAFARTTIGDTFRPRYPFDTELDARFVYLDDGTERLILGVLDVSFLFRDTSRLIRDAIARATGVPLERVMLHELQHHSAPEALDLAGEPARRIAAKSIAALRPAIADAQPCVVGTAVVDVGDRFNHVREQFVPDLGTVTVWGDYAFADDGRAHVENPGQMLLQGWQPDLPAFSDPLYFDRPADTLVPLLVFRTPNGRPLGTILRFAAHVVAVNFRQHLFDDRHPPFERDYRYSFDYPGYARLQLEEMFGGTALYLNGPCGDLVPKMRPGATFDDGRRESRRIGRELADAAGHGFASQDPTFAPLRLTGFAHRAIDLPIRDSIPRSRDELRDLSTRIDAAREELRRLIDSGTWPTRIKRQIDWVNHLTVLDHLVNGWINMSDDELRRRAIAVEVEAFGLNDLIFVGVPGEALTDTAQWIRNQTFGRRVVPVDQVNGYCSYLVTPERMAEGGYAHWGSALARDAERVLRRAAVDAVMDVAERRGASA